MLNMVNVSKVYGKVGGDCSVTALDSVNLEIRDNEFVGIIGSSGSGKSTLLNLLGALDMPTDGEVWLDDCCISKLNDIDRAKLRLKNYGFIFQSFFLEPSFTVLKNTVMPLIISGMDKKIREERGMEILSQLGLEDKINKKAGELSGGQMQRVSIARALVHKPKVIFADEPTGNLDSKNGEIIIEIFNQIVTSGASVVMVTHNETHLIPCSKIIRLTDGRIV